MSQFNHAPGQGSEEETKVIEATAGDSIGNYANVVAKAASQLNVEASFNGIDITIPKGVYSSEDILQMFTDAKARKEKEMYPEDAATPGEGINDYTVRLAKLALENDVNFRFNSIKFALAKGVYTPNDIRKTREDLFSKMPQFADSPEGKAQKEGQDTELKEKQLGVDYLTKQLETLDFLDVKKVLEWHVEFFKVSSIVGIEYDKEKILARFAENGYVPNMNVGSEFNPEDKENFAKNLIGQCLLGILKRSTSQVILRLYKEWQAKFSDTSTSRKKRA